jgi:flagellar biosynthetic protein FlhB
MADDHDVERNYPATPRRLEQARERGEVARSRELTTAAVVGAGAIAFSLLGPALARHSLQLFHDGLVLDREAAFSDARMVTALSSLSAAALAGLAPLLVLILAASLAAPLLLSGWVFSAQALVPDFKRLNPLSGLSNIVSKHALAELIKAIAKSLLLGGIGAWSIWHAWHEMQMLAVQDLGGAVAGIGSVVTTAFYALTGGLALIALADVPYQIWRYHDQLKMTREELRQELREMEGDPQLKARVRSLQREASRKRMMAAVPKATVIVTNPTHYAVALEYREGMRAPKVVAKGIELVAQKIREIGNAHGVPMLEAPPLARALYRHAELDSEIPAALYTVVAQVLAYVYQVRRYRAQGGPAPVAPTALDVPDEMDPGPHPRPVPMRRSGVAGEGSDA